MTSKAIDNSRDIAVIDRAIASALPGVKTVQFGDCRMPISALQVFRQRLVAEESTKTGVQPNAVTPATGTFTPWTGGTIPYRFDPTQVSGGTITAAKMQQFRDGTGEWAAAANVHFVEFSGTTPANFVTVQENSSLGGGESTAVGMEGGEQFLEFGPQAWNRGTVCHEIGHALGYIHEQQRDDRDTYVIIDWSNIPSGQQANFTKLPGGATEYGAYDFYSVMEYSRNALATDPSQDTITMQPAYAQYANIIGNVPDRTLSTLDRAGMAALYGNPSTLPGAVVTTTNDSGIGSLRSAIYYAFDRSTQTPALTTTITFQIPKSDAGYNSSTGVFTIAPTYELDALGDGTTIDGTTQTTFAGDSNPKGPEVVINGAAFANYEGIGAGYQPAFILRQANCILKGMVIQGCDEPGIEITGAAATGNVVSGCYVGTDATGTSSVPNAVAGIEIFGGAHSNTIGGTTSAARNVISGNTNQGIVLVDPGTTGNVVAGNYIGLNPAGKAAVANGTGDSVNHSYYPGVGIFNGAASNTIGGSTAGSANVISGNYGGGISISGTGSNANVVAGNFIGTNPGGTAAIANGNTGVAGYIFTGISMFGATQSNVIGGTTAAARNIISGNAGQGIYLGGFGTNANVIEGNYIGTDVSGVTAIANGFSGIGVFSSAASNTIGGTVAGAQNIISGNTQQGIAMGQADTGQTVGPTLNVIEGNAIGVNINGAALANGYDGVDLYGGAQSNTVGGLTSVTRNIISGNSGYGVNLSNAGTSLNVIEGNVIGMNAAGTAAVANAFSGLSIFGAATANTIGGTTTAARNLISGNSGYGIQVSGAGTSSNTVEGNFIGVDVTGAHAFGNSFAGVDIDGGATSNTVGGNSAVARNIISGNPNEDVVVDGSGTTANVVEGNYIGLDTTGVTAIASSNEGVAIFGSATGNTIGGTSAGARNYISGHSSSGLAISGSGTNGNIVAGNTVGLNVNSAVVTNAAQGLVLFGGAQSNVIGGTTAGASNIIAGNTAEGIAFFDNTTIDNSISENSIYGNSLGIALYSESNNSQVAPALGSAVAGSGTTVVGTLSSTASETFRIEFFSSPSGNEGQTFIGSANVTTNSAGTASINATVPPIVTTGFVVTATATDPSGNTSPFSSPVTVTGGSSGPPGIVTTQPAVANSDQAALSWTAISGATSYTVGRSTVSGGPYTTVGSGSSATSFTDTNLTDGTTYYYVVAAVNGSGPGPNSAQVVVTPTSQNLFWDTTTAAGLANGSGSWDNNTTAKWSNSSAGASNPLLTWFSDDTASFQTAGTFTATVPTGTTIKLGSLTQAVAGTSLTVAGGTLQFDTNAGIVSATGTNHSTILNSAIVLNSPNVTLDNESSVGTLQLNGFISETGGSRAMNKVGAGVIALGSVANTFSGGFVLNSAGQVTFGHNASFGTGAITFNAGTSLTSTAQIYAASTTTVTGLANNLTFNAGCFGAYTGGRTMALTGSLLGSGTFFISPTTSATSVTLSGDDHAFTGSLVYNDNGTTPLLLGAANSGSASSIWTLTGGKTKGIGANVTGNNTFLLGELASANGIGRLFNNQASGTATFQLGDATANAPSFAGVITDGTAGGKVGLLKANADNQILTGADTYTGPTTISAGTLTVNGSLAAGSMVTVSAGATLAGAGTIGGPATLVSGGFITPGGSGAVGKLTLAGTSTFNGGGILNFDLATTTTSDALALTGAYVAPASGTVTINLNALTGFANGSYPLITGATGINAASFTLGTLPSGHSYQLSATGSALSVIVSATASAPSAPANLAAVPGASVVNLTWSASTGATSYTLMRGTTNGGPYPTIFAAQSGTSLADMNVTNGTTYYYVVTATNTGGTSGNSNQASATPTTGVSPPAMVTGVTAAPGANQIALSWTAVNGATSYTVGSSTVSGGPYTTVSSGSAATTFTNTGLTNGTIYYYVVAALNGSVNGPNSTEVSATPGSQNLYWDTTTAAGLANGSGIWDTGMTPKWSSTSAGTSNPLLTWGTDDNAFFQTAGTLTATLPTGTTVKLSSLTQAVAGTALTVAGGTLQLDGNGGIVSATGTNHSTILNSAIVLNSSSVTLDNEASVGTIQLNGAISELGGSRALNKVGPGVIALGSVANTFSGGFSLSSVGQVTIGNNASFGTGAITFNAGTSLTSTAQIYTASTTSVTGLANNLMFNAGSFGAYTGGRAMMLGGSLLGAGTFSITPTTSATSITLSGDNHNFAGNLVYNDNGTTTLLLGAGNSGSASAIWTLTGGKTKGVGANVAGSNTFPIGELASATDIGRLFNNQASSTATFQLGDATANAPTFAGVIADGTAGGKTGVTMTGFDNQILTGANTYTGPTTISGGTLTVNGSLAAGSTVTVNANGTLSGSGTIGGATNLSSGGNIAPGGSGTVGKLTLAGGFNLNSGGVLDFDLATTTNSDMLALTGAYVPPASGTAKINLLGLAGFGNGTYPLITGATGISAGSFALGSTPAGHSYQLSTSGTTLSVVVGTGSSAPVAPAGLAADAANGEIDLAWSASTGATTYTLMRGTVNGGPYPTIISGLASTSYSDMSLVNGTTYYYVVTATNGSGTSGNSNQAAATPNTTTVDSYWSDNDIGAVGQAGSSSYSSGTFTLNGSGTGVSGTADSFDFTQQALVGDGAIIAKVATQAAGASGVQMRESMAANARVVDMVVQGGAGAIFQDRAMTGGSAVNGATAASIAAPYWVKLARAGNIFAGSISPDGVTWTQVGTVTIAMASSINVGLAQSSLSNSSLASATFTNVAIVPTSSWSSADIGTVPIAGASYYSNGVATVQGAGASLFTGADQFRYTYLSVSGDCDITARVATETNTSASAKVGVMIRAGLTDTAAHATVYVTPTSGVGFEYRTTTGGTTTSITVSGPKAPYWLRLVRSGTTFSAFRSVDGTTWTALGTPQTITMPTAVYIGLPVCSYNINAICTGTFDNITVDP